MKVLSALFISGALSLAPSLASAACLVQGSGEINVISNSYPSTEVISRAVQACQSDQLAISWKLTRESETETKQALDAKVSPYDIAQVSNSSISPLQAAGMLQPMNDLVEKYRDKFGIQDSMLIKFGDDIMAIAFQVNAQNLYYRKDVLEKYGIAVPTTYEELLAAAEILKREEAIEYPLGGTYKAGWNLAQEFVNIYLGLGGEFFESGSPKPAFNNDKGVQTLELMKRLIGYMSPNALALDTTAVMQQFQQGSVAMANFWASRAGKMDDPNESQVVGLIDFAAAPAATAGGAPATTLWWDGLVLPKNMDGDRDLAFQLIMEGLRDQVVEANNDVTIWLHPAYQAGRYSIGVAESAQGGAPSFPMLPQMTMAHAAIGNNIGDFLVGNESAQKSLKDAESAYIKAAKEAGYLK
ncbi:ABC transporter substrate-binding protein [Zobellella maritima]|uniref:ABC transporter substrate-binding protein n=1 Tax=Zobellella maritima TaxID=2059725 RepID=UPI000E30AB6B|nr:extracellular solute-binding protein [Zobellella maritima]